MEQTPPSSERKKEFVEDCIWKVNKNGRVQFLVEVSIRNLEGKKPVRPTKSAYAPKLSIAREVRESLRDQLKKEFLTPAHTVETFFVEKFMPELEATRSKKSAENFRIDFTGKVLPVLGKLRLEEVTSAAVSDFIFDAKYNWLPSTRAKYRKYLSQFFKAAKNRKLVTEDPMEGVKKVPGKKKTKKLFLSPSEVQKLLRFLFENKHPLRFHVAVAVLLGARVNEQRGLRWSDVLWDMDLVYIQRIFNNEEGYRPHTKTGDQRYVPLPPALKAILLELKRLTQPASEDSPLLPEHRKFDTGEQGDVLKDILEILDLPKIRWYDFRATYTVGLAESQVPIHRIAQILGHTDVQMVCHYLRDLGTGLRGSADALRFVPDDVVDSLATTDQQIEMIPPGPDTDEQKKKD